MTVTGPKVEQCPKCKSMKPIGSLYHAPMLRHRDGMKCAHGCPWWSDCTERIPPPCCWGMSGPHEKVTT